MAASHGEMPFLDHLEELRSRILKGLGAVIAGFAAGLWVVQHFEFVSLLKQPIAPYLPGGRLTVLSPTEPVMIVLKLSFLIGLVLASPFLLYQVWGFLSPALYDKERRAFVPALLFGTLRCLVGAALGYVFVVPQALRVLFSFQSAALQPMITYDAYFSFVMQILIGLGLAFEIPLVITILAAFGLVTPAVLHRFRRFEVVLAFAAGALLSPGGDVLSMTMMTIPILVLYEVGFAGAVLMHRRRIRRAAAAAPPVCSRSPCGTHPPRRRSRRRDPGPRKRSRIRRRPTPPSPTRRPAPGSRAGRWWIPPRPGAWGCRQRRSLYFRSRTRPCSNCSGGSGIP